MATLFRLSCDMPVFQPDGFRGAWTYARARGNSDDSEEGPIMLCLERTATEAYVRGGKRLPWFSGTYPVWEAPPNKYVGRNWAGGVFCFGGMPYANTSVVAHYVAGSIDERLLAHVCAVSGPLQAQTISGTLDFAIPFRADDGTTFYLCAHAYVTQGDTQSIRGVLLDNHQESAPADWMKGVGTDLSWGALCGPAAPVALSSVTCSSGDRVVVEFGVYVSTSTNGYIWTWSAPGVKDFWTDGHGMYEGKGAKGDLVFAQSYIGMAACRLMSWVEFSQTLLEVAPSVQVASFFIDVGYMGSMGLYARVGDTVRAREDVQLPVIRINKYETITSRDRRLTEPFNEDWTGLDVLFDQTFEGGPPLTTYAGYVYKTEVQSGKGAGGSTYGVDTTAGATDWRSAECQFTIDSGSKSGLIEFDAKFDLTHCTDTSYGYGYLPGAQSSSFTDYLYIVIANGVAWDNVGSSSDMYAFYYSYGYDVETYGSVLLGTAASLADGNWKHLMFKWQASSSDGALDGWMKFYIDGTEKLGSAALNIDVWNPSWTRVYFGYRWIAYIDNLRVGGKGS